MNKVGSKISLIRSKIRYQIHTLEALNDRSSIDTAGVDPGLEIGGSKPGGEQFSFLESSGYIILLLLSM